MNIEVHVFKADTSHLEYNSTQWHTENNGNVLVCIDKIVCEFIIIEVGQWIQGVHYIILFEFLYV